MSASLLQHPQATHQIRISDWDVAYLLVRSARKTVGLEIGPAGLVVRAPQRAPLTWIEQVLQDKARWVISKLQARVASASLAPTIVWQQGAVVPYLGGQLQVHWHPAAPQEGTLLSIGPGQWTLHLRLAVDAPPATVRALLQAWWIRHARTLMTERLQRYAPALGVQWQQLRVSNARTRWGSATHDGRIMLNWRLLHHRLEVLDYVVIHELAHLRVMDHSPRFWAVVAAVCPDYVALRAALRQQLVPHWGGLA